MDSTDSGLEALTPLELAAARGELPDWARASPGRREHMRRVAALMEGWAHRLRLPESEALRWAASGWLHDVLRDADPAELRREVAPAERDLPGAILHGPAAARRLRGQVAPEVAAAIHYHTLGHPELDRLGHALYLADFLEPGRTAQRSWRDELCARMPGELEAVLLEVVAFELEEMIARRLPIRPEVAAFWSALVSTGS